MFKIQIELMNVIPMLPSAKMINKKTYTIGVVHQYNVCPPSDLVKTAAFGP